MRLATLALCLSVRPQFRPHKRRSQTTGTVTRSGGRGDCHAPIQARNVIRACVSDHEHGYRERYAQ